MAGVEGEVAGTELLVVVDTASDEVVVSVAPSPFRPDMVDVEPVVPVVVGESGSTLPPGRDVDVVVASEPTHPAVATAATASVKASFLMRPICHLCSRL